MGDALDAFNADYITGRNERIAEQAGRRSKRAWELSQQAYTHLETAPVPTEQINMWIADNRDVPDERIPERVKGSFMGIDVDIPARKFAKQRKNEFVNALEVAWHANRGRVPLGFLAQYDAADLQMWGADEIYNLQQIAEAQLFAAQHQEFLDAIDAETEKRFKAQSRGNSFFGRIQLGSAAFLDDVLPGEGRKNEAFASMMAGTVDKADIRDDVWKEFTGQLDQVYNDDIEEWWVRRRKELEGKFSEESIGAPGSPEAAAVKKAEIDFMREQIVAGGDPGDIMDQRSAFHNVVAGGLSGLGMGIDLLTTGVGGALWMIDLAPGSNAGIFSPYDWFVTRSQQGQEALRIEYERAIAEPDEDMMRKAAAVGIEQAWELMETEAPDQRQVYLDMAGGDPILAAGFFGADVVERPDVKKQLEGMVDDQRAAQELMIEDLRESDFRFSHEVLDVISMWGRNGPLRVATGFALLLSDEDYWDELTQGKIAQVYNDIGENIEEVGFSPAGALGIDGSLAGLFTDLGLGIVFDPLTWIMGPKFLGAAKGAAAGTIDDVSRLVRSPMMRQMTRDIVDFSVSQSRGASSVYHISNWLGDTALFEILDVIGFQPKLLKARDWVNHVTGKVAQEVDVSFLRNLLHEDDLARIDTGFDAAKLGDDLVERGFKEAGEIVYSRADETFHFTDGVKRMLGAEAAGIKKMPVRLRVVDKAAKGRRVVEGFVPKEVAVLEQIAARGRGTGGVVVKGADDAVRDATLTQAKVIHEASGSVPVPGPSISLKKGSLQTYRTGTGDKVAYYAINESGDVVAAVIGGSGRVTSGSGGLNMAVAKGSTRQGVMDQLWKIAQKEGDEFVLQVGLSGSISENAIEFGAKFADDILKTSQKSLGTKGVNSADVLNGAKVKKPLRKLNDGEQTIRPDRMIPRESLVGKIDEVKIGRIVERAMENGATPNGVRQSIMHATVPARVRDILLRGDSREISSLFTKMNTTTEYAFQGPGAIQRIMDQSLRMWGQNVAKADQWMGRIFDVGRRAQAVVARNQARLAALMPRHKAVTALLDSTGGVWDDALRFTKGLSSTEKAVAKGNRAQLQEALTNEIKIFEKEYLAVQKSLETMPGNADLAKVIQEMWEDFNRTEIAPKWKLSDLDDTGMVPWETLKRGRHKDVRPKNPEGRDWVPSDLVDIANDAGVKDVEKLAKMLNNIPETPMSVNVPLSPLDMLAATTHTGTAWTKWTQTAVGNWVRNRMQEVHKMWVIDKVLRPATAATVSTDELVRIAHKGGRFAVNRYINDRVMFMNARIQLALHGKPVQAFGRDAVARGSRYSPKLRARLENLAEHSMRGRQFERIFYDDHGLGWTDIFPKEGAVYRDAAKRWTGGMIQQSGFRAFLRGPDAFSEWFFSVDGEALRNASVLEKGVRGNPQTGILHSVDAAFEGWTNLFEKVILKRARDTGKYDEVLQAFRDTAAQVDNVGGKAIDLPDWVFDHMGPVRGAQRHQRKSASPLRLTDDFFDRFFLDPVNYRQGFVSEMVATSERARLEALFASQGKRIVSDMELNQVLGIKGVAGVTRPGAQGFLTEQALKRGIIPQSYVDDLVQRAVDTEVDHILYQAEQGSRVGQGLGRTVFPFGKPWADMAGFWGREMLRRPALRGKLNEGNFNLLGDILTARGHFNPRTASLISRLSATDFTIDQGFLGAEEGETQGLLPGSEETDLSPLLFLPTAGENAFGSILPGFGWAPMWAFDMIAQEFYDPIKDPEGWQAFLDTVGDFVPGVHFGNPDPNLALVQRLLGGGTFGQAAEGLLDVATLTGNGGSFDSVFTYLGQPDREIDRTRMMSAILADPAEWDDLLSLDNAEDIELALAALALEADQKSASGNIAEQGSRFLLPANNKFSGDLDMIHDVWVTAGQAFPDLGVDPNFDDATATPEQRKQYASDVRRSFFNLPQTSRDRFIVEQPTLAVNLVSTWEWTDKAHAQGVDGTELSYRTDGSRKGLALHDVLIRSGMIRPLEPIERARRILGLHFAAKENTAKQIYTEMAGQVNNVMWEQIVDDETKTLLDQMLQEVPKLATALDVRDGRELWEAWGRFEGDFEAFIARALDIDLVRGESTKKADLTEFDRLRSFLSVPTKQKAWGTTWPGVDDEGLSKRFSEMTFTDFDYTDTTRDNAAALEIGLSPRMTGLQLFTEVNAVVTETASPLAIHVAPAYDAYIGTRSA